MIKQREKWAGETRVERSSKAQRASECNVPILHYPQRHDSADHFRECRYEPRLISTCSIRSHALDHRSGNPAARACARAIDPRWLRDNAAARVILGSWSRFGLFGALAGSRETAGSPRHWPNVTVKVTGREQEACRRCLASTRLGAPLISIWSRFAPSLGRFRWTLISPKGFIAHGMDVMAPLNARQRIIK